MRFLPLITAIGVGLAPSMTVAHPHIYVGVEMAVIFDGDATPEVRLNWVYDDYFSLLITADLGIDLDGDLQLTAEETQILAGAVTAWPPDFQGDLEVSQNGAVLPLAEKYDHRMVYADGIVRETHVRPVRQLADASLPLTIRAYDPFYYVAYSLVGPVRIEGREDCSVTVTPPDLDRAYSLVEELLYGRPANDVGPDEEFPEVGVEFAETVTITCEQPL